MVRISRPEVGTTQKDGCPTRDSKPEESHHHPDGDGDGCPPAYKDYTADTGRLDKADSKNPAHLNASTKANSKSLQDQQTKIDRPEGMNVGKKFTDNAQEGKKEEKDTPEDLQAPVHQVDWEGVRQAKDALTQRLLSLNAENTAKSVFQQEYDHDVSQIEEIIKQFHDGALPPDRALDERVKHHAFTICEGAMYLMMTNRTHSENSFLLYLLSLTEAVERLSAIKKYKCSRGWFGYYADVFERVKSDIRLLLEALDDNILLADEKGLAHAMNRVQDAEPC